MRLKLRLQERQELWYLNLGVILQFDLGGQKRL